MLNGRTRHTLKQIAGLTTEKERESEFIRLINTLIEGGELERQIYDYFKFVVHNMVPGRLKDLRECLYAKVLHNPDTMPAKGRAKMKDFTADFANVIREAPMQLELKFQYNPKNACAIDIYVFDQKFTWNVFELSNGSYSKKTNEMLAVIYHRNWFKKRPAFKQFSFGRERFKRTKWYEALSNGTVASDDPDEKLLATLLFQRFCQPTTPKTREVLDKEIFKLREVEIK
jgi:hypothetical protein